MSEIALCTCVQPVPVDGDGGLAECLICTGIVAPAEPVDDEDEETERADRPVQAHQQKGKIR